MMGNMLKFFGWLQQQKNVAKKVLHKSLQEVVVLKGQM
jgi:hypothetical protein